MDRPVKYVSQGKLPDFRSKNIPEICPILGHKDITPVVDHDHKSGRIRGVISSEGNAFLGKIENYFRGRGSVGPLDLPTVLRNMANYLEQEQGPFHPVGIRQVQRSYKSKKKAEQIKILQDIGASDLEISECKNSSSRSKLLRKILVS